MGQPTQLKVNRSKVTREQELCFDLRLQGHSIRAIAAIASEHLGYNISKTTVHERIEAEIAQRIQPRAEALREMELSRIDAYLVALSPKIAAGDEKAIATALRCGERRAKLLGLDSAIVVESTITEVSAEDIELAEMIREARARNHARLAQG